ncbi:MAG: hypothetical protein ISN29_02415 [Gammaproteobacteria bacterium AqS3]|nr:hypothetical protein [Gammaproteobacteria bacterium AqS3]
MYRDRDPDVFRKSDGKVESIMREVTEGKRQREEEKQKKIIREVLAEYGINPIMGRVDRFGRRKF